MFQREIEQDLPRAQSGSCLGLIKKLIPQGQTLQPGEQLAENLERLALSAPHVLPDIGFERDLAACSPEKTVWRRGTVCVVISTATRTVSISLS
jgi:hypothetical protein